MKSKLGSNFEWVQASEPLMQTVDNLVNSRQAFLKEELKKEEQILKKGVTFSNFDSIEIFDGNSPISKRGAYKHIILTIVLFIALFLAIIAILLVVDIWFLSHSDSQEFNITISEDDQLINISTLVTKTNIIEKENSNFRWHHCGQSYINSNIDPSIHVKPVRKRRIIGGEDAVAHSYPFLASVRVLFNNGSEHHCGGTLITDSHVLTAAHCVILYVRLLTHLNMSMSQIYSLIEVHVGINQHENNLIRQNKDQNGVSNEDEEWESQNAYGVEWFDWHNEFKFTPTILYNDIAILKLKRKVNLDRPQVNVVCLPNPNKTTIKYGDNVVAIGWGTYAEDYNYTAYVKDDLQQAVFQVKDERDEECIGGSVGGDWDREKTVCAHGSITNGKTHSEDSSIVKKSTCYGDSGGPVLTFRENRWVLVGIISFGHDTRDVATNKKKCNASMPFYFVNVSMYFEWINRRTNYTLAHFQ